MDASAARAQGRRRSIRSGDRTPGAHGGWCGNRVPRLEVRRGEEVNPKSPNPKAQDPNPSRRRDVGIWVLGFGAWDFRVSPTCSLGRRRTPPALDGDLLDGPCRAIAFVHHVLRLAVDLVD